MARAGSGPYGFHGSWIIGSQGLLGCYNLAFTKEFGSLVFKRVNWIIETDTWILTGFQWILLVFNGFRIQGFGYG